MERLKVPDLIIERSIFDVFFESSDNLVFARTSKSCTELYFTNRGLVSISSSVARLKNKLRDKGFISIADRLMIRLEHLREIVHEDFQYYILLKGCDRIPISFKDAEFIKGSLRRIAS